MRTVAAAVLFAGDTGETFNHFLEFRTNVEVSCSKVRIRDHHVMYAFGEICSAVDAATSRDLGLSEAISI